MSLEEKTFDVAICGGGLAGLTLARQLKLKYPGMSVVIIDKSQFPVTRTTWKVGESSVEASGYYFCHALELEDYFKNQHFKKLGLRFFIGPGSQELVARPEIGLSGFPQFDSYLYDRGVFENDLHLMNQQCGVEIIEGARIKEIILDEGHEPHRVSYKRQGIDGVEELRARWVVDAMGRVRHLQRKLDLSLPSQKTHSAVWFRIKGRFDVADLVDRNDLDWHFRVPHRIRYFSVNHMIGVGYWIWIIPLATGCTSIGLVTSEDHHPFNTIDTYEKCIAWLEKNEPQIGQSVKHFEVLDFLKMRNYSYSSKQVFSTQRWACTGDAAVFPDPYYSPGGNFIAFGNTMAVKMIGLEMEGKLNEDLVDRCNSYLISQNEWLTRNIQASYAYFDRPQIMSLSFLWDICGGWAFVVPNLIHELILDDDLNEIFQKSIRPYIPMAVNMSKLFVAWAEKSRSNKTFTHIDYLALPFVKAIYQRNCQLHKTPEQLAMDLPQNLADMETLARVVFSLAIEDILPEERARLGENLSFNPSAFSLNPEKWEQDGMFDVQTSQLDPAPLLEQLNAIYRDLEGEEPVSDEADSFDFSF